MSVTADLEQARAPRARTSQGAVLVIDDDDHNRQALALLLRRQGYEVVECVDAQDAHVLMTEGYNPEAILLDLMMPRMDGWEFRVLLKENAQWCTIPVIAMSADQSAKAKAIHADSYLAKPIDPRVLGQTLQRLIARSRAENESSRARQVEQLDALSKLAGEILTQLERPLEFTLGNLQLAQDRALQLEQRLSGGHAFSMVGIRQLLARAQRGAERIEGLVHGTATFAHLIRGRLMRATPRVLLVDGDAASSSSLVDALGVDYRVDALGSASTALDAIERRTPYDVVLCELVAPSFVGAELHRVLTERGSPLVSRLVFITDGPFDGELRSFLATTRRPQVRKPIQMHQLRALIEAQLVTVH